MDLLEAIEARHSIRRFTDQPIDAAVVANLQELIAECNRESGLAIKLYLDEPVAFSNLIGRLRFGNVRNYLALVGPDAADLQQKCGYYGQKIMLRTVQLGLGSCWFGMGVKKSAIEIAPGQKLVIVIALGNPAAEGKPHSSKPLEDLYRVEDGQALPEWFERGIKAAQLAPTATNQQKFRFSVTGNRVKVESTGGFYPQVDLGIVRYHFEVAAGVENFQWA
jgi:nitroreductase